MRKKPARPWSPRKAKASGPKSTDLSYMKTNLAFGSEMQGRTKAPTKKSKAAHGEAPA